MIDMPDTDNTNVHSLLVYVWLMQPHVLQS